MTRPAPIPDRLTHRVFTRTEALSLVSPDDLRGPSYQRILRGMYCRADGGITQTERIMAAMQVMPAGTVLSGTSALWTMSVKLADPDDPVEVIVPPGSKVRNRSEIRVRRDVLLPDEVMGGSLGPRTTPARTAFDVARMGPPLQTVPLLDALARRTNLRPEQVLAVAAAHPHARWLSRVAPALDLMDPGAESVRESELRVVITLGGLPRPKTQHKIFTPDGRFVARVDLAWLLLRVACEYDGAHHDDPAQIRIDRARLNAIRRVGWTPIVIDAAQFARRTDMLALISAVLDQAAHA